LQRNLREEVLKILLSITPAEARAEEVDDGEEYDTELTKMAETATEKGVNEISAGDKNLDSEFSKGGASKTAVGAEAKKRKANIAKKKKKQARQNKKNARR
jgi:tyrosine-protein phosphatase YwqE